MEFQAVEYPNESACQGAQEAILNHAKVKSNTVAGTWGYILGQDGKCLVVVDERIDDFPFSPNAIETFSTDNTNYFPTE